MAVPWLVSGPDSTCESVLGWLSSTSNRRISQHCLKRYSVCACVCVCVCVFVCVRVCVCVCICSACDYDCECAFKCKILCTGVCACESGHVCTHLRMRSDITQSSCPRPTVYHMLRANFGSDSLPSVSLLLISVISKHAGIRTC